MVPTRRLTRGCPADPLHVKTSEKGEGDDGQMQWANRHILSHSEIKFMAMRKENRETENETPDRIFYSKRGAKKCSNIFNCEKNKVLAGSARERRDKKVFVSKDVECWGKAGRGKPNHISSKKRIKRSGK